MSLLKSAIEDAYKHNGAKDKVSKAHLALLKTRLFLPVKNHPDKDSTSEKEPDVLFLKQDNHYFVPVFSEKSYFQQWATEIREEVGVIEFSAHDVISGLGAQSYLCLDIGTQHYKEFSPDELARLKGIVDKLRSNTKTASDV